MSLTLLTLRTRVSRRIGKSDTDYLTKIEDWLDERYDFVIRRRNWRRLVRQVDVSAVANAETMVLPKDVEIVLAVYDRENDLYLDPVEVGPANRLYGEIQDESGTPRKYFPEEDTVNAQPTSASALAVSSSDAADTTQKVRVIGIAGGEQRTETVTLNGTTAVNTVNSYTRVIAISKDGNTAGVITVTSNAAAVTVATIDPLDVAPRYPKLHLIRRPDSAISYTVTYKVKVPPLINAEDVPLIPCESVLIRGAYADALAEQKQFEKAAIEEAMFDKFLANLITEEEQHPDMVHRAIPHIERAAIDETP
jgi:hypothetical protein